MSWIAHAGLPGAPCLRAALPSSQGGQRSLLDRCNLCSWAARVTAKLTADHCNIMAAWSAPAALTPYPVDAMAWMPCQRHCQNKEAPRIFYKSMTVQTCLRRPRAQPDAGGSVAVAGHVSQHLWPLLVAAAGLLQQCGHSERPALNPLRRQLPLQPEGAHSVELRGSWPDAKEDEGCSA